MATLIVPDIKLKPATVGSKGARALQRLDIDNQRRARMLQTLKQMGLDEPGLRSTKSSRNNSAESLRRSSEPTSSSGESDKLTLSNAKSGRRRSLMIESLHGLGPMLNNNRVKNGGVSGAFNRGERKSLGAVPSRLAPVQDLTEEEDTENPSNRLFPGTPYRDLRSGRRRSLNVARTSQHNGSPRVSIEGDLLNPEDDRHLSVSRRRSRRARTPKGRLLTGPSESVEQTNTVSKKQKLQVEKPKRFRVCVRLLISFIRLCESYFLSAADDSKEDYFDDAVQLMFDVRFFKAVKQLDISQDCRTILAKPQHLRTEKEKYHALIAMRNYPTFAEYPLTMQQDIIACGWYARYQAKRVILRQGHLPLNFYFILSGSAVVRVVDKSTGVATTVVYLNRGETFGELGIVNQAARQSTIIAREWIELLCINDEDYTRIFMAGGLTKLLDPDHSDFVRNLKFLEGWPLPLLAKSPRKCIFSYFKRRDILVKNSKTSDWIVVIKSGSCSVMKLLYKRTRSDTTHDDNDKDLPTNITAIKKKTNRSKKRVSNVNLEDFEQRKKREDFEDFMKDLNIQDHKEMIEDSLQNTLRENSLIAGAAVEEADGSKRVGGGKASRSTRGKKNNVPQLSRTGYLARKKAHERVFQEVAILGSDTAPSQDSEAEDELAPLSNEVTDITNEAAVGKRKTLIDDIMEADIAEEVEEGMEPVWVTVQTLTKGSVFGLAEMMFDDQPSFVVVSNGAECILLSKKFYMEHATLAMLSKLGREQHRFPTEDELKLGLDIKLRWNSYKEEHFKQTLEHKRRSNVSTAI